MPLNHSVEDAMLASVVGWFHPLAVAYVILVWDKIFPMIHMQLSVWYVQRRCGETTLW